MTGSFKKTSYICSSLGYITSEAMGFDLVYFVQIPSCAEGLESNKKMVGYPRNSLCHYYTNRPSFPGLEYWYLVWSTEGTNILSEK